MTKKLHAFLIPMHNEETVIQKTLWSLKKAGVNWDDVYLVDDGCKDGTLKKIKEVGFRDDHVCSLFPNVGKTGALIAAFDAFDLDKKYEWVNTLDADTILKENYMERLLWHLQKAPANLAAVCSRVHTTRGIWNLFVAYRVYEYCISHRVYKQAQGLIKLVTVLPGCGSTFRAKIFRELSKHSDPTIITEDLDWTISIHHQNMGFIQYDEDLIVITQDPNSMTSYLKQVHRWFRGVWQVWRKRSLYNIFAKTRINAEVSALLIEGLLFGSAFAVAVIFYLLGIWTHFTHLFFKIDFIIFFGLTFLVSLREMDFRVIVFMPLFYLLRFTNCIVFVTSFIEIIVMASDKTTKLQWNKVNRY